MSDNVKTQVGYEPTSRVTDLAAPMVVTVWSPVEEFQALAMRSAVKVLLPGNVDIAN